MSVENAHQLVYGNTALPAGSHEDVLGRAPHHPGAPQYIHAACRKVYEHSAMCRSKGHFPHPQQSGASSQNFASFSRRRGRREKAGFCRIYVQAKFRGPRVLPVVPMGDMGFRRAQGRRNAGGRKSPIWAGKRPCHHYVTVIFHSDSDRLLFKSGKDRPIVQALQICRSTEHVTAGTALKPEPGQRPDRIRESTSALGTYSRGSSTTSTRRVARILALIGVGQRPGGRRLQVAYMERR